MKLNLSKRAGQIGPSINTRTELYGAEPVPAVDIPVSGIFLDEAELNAVLQDPGAHAALFTQDRSPATEPRFMGINPLTMSDKFSGAKVTISADGVDALVLKPAKIKNIRLEPFHGGLTHMSCTVQGNPADHTDVLQLLNKKCRIAVLNAELLEKPEDGDEPELGLDHKGQGDESPPETEDTELSKTGRAITASAKKRARKDRSRKDVDG